MISAIDEMGPIVVEQLRGLIASPSISANAISGYKAVPNATTKGVDLGFALTDVTGIATVTLLRNYTMDAGTATVLQTWAALKQGYTWSDTDLALQTHAAAFYWIRLAPTGTTGTPLTVGPQEILLNPQLVAPLGATAVSASHAAAVNGAVLVTVNVSGGPPQGSIKIYVQGYEGNPAPVAVAQAAQSPLQFTLQATGETVTIQAVAVSAGGAQATSGPTTTLLLNGTATVPATPQGVTVAQIATGNQITFGSSREAVTSYILYRAQRGQAFVSATMLATLAATGAGTLVYLDTAGLTGDWEYFVVAVGAAGNSQPSPPANPLVLFSSALLPPNALITPTNTASVTSVDTGSAVEILIDGPGGAGTSYTRLTGFGTLSRPNGTINGLLYSTVYVVLYTGTAYVAVTTYVGTLPDAWEFVGTVTTTAPTGVVGSGATVTLVINGAGNVIQANPGAVGSGYSAATVNIAGGGGSGAHVTANVVGGQVTSYTVTNGGSGYATAPVGTVVGAGGGGTTGGGGSTGGQGGSRGRGLINVN